MTDTTVYVVDEGEATAMECNGMDLATYYYCVIR